jgi:hypothetical protein
MALVAGAPGTLPHQVAPSLCAVIREGLQRKEVSPENITLYLTNFQDLSITRYEKGLHALWNLCMETAKGSWEEGLVVAGKNKEFPRQYRQKIYHQENGMVGGGTAPIANGEDDDEVPVRSRKELIRSS